VRTSRRRRRKEAAARGDGFIDHDGVFGIAIAIACAIRAIGQRAGRLCKVDQRLRLGVARPGAERGRQRFEGGNRVFAAEVHAMHLAAFRLQQAGLFG